MSKIINVGRVTAYADAVKGGYQGTREEWESDLANLGTTAAEVEADRQEVAANTAAVATDKGIVEGYKDAANLSAQASAASAGAAHTDALAATAAKEASETAQGLAESAKDSAVAAKGGAETAQGAAEAAVTQASGYADNASGSATAAAGSATAAAGSATDAAASATAAAGSADEAEAVLESIPEDYSTLSNDVTDLKSAISYDIAEITVDKGTLVANEYVKFATGEFLPYNGWSRTGYLPCDKYTQIKLSTNTQYCAFYDAEHGYVQRANFVANTYLDVPDNAAYFAISGTTNILPSVIVTAKSKGLGYVLDESINNINDIIITEKTESGSSLIDGYLISGNGVPVALSEWVCTDYIAMPFDEKSGYAIRGTFYGIGGCAIYDKNNIMLLAINGNNVASYSGTSVKDLQTIYIDGISGAAKIRISGYKSNTASASDLWIKGNTFNGVYEHLYDTEKDITELKANISTTVASSKVLVIGDSISTDSYGNYKKWVTDLIAEGFLPSDTTNSSQHATGFVARYNNQPNDFISRIKAISDPSQYDLVIVFGGINDYIQNIPMGEETGTDYTVSFKPAVNEFFNYLIQNFTQARICVLLPLRTYATWQNSVDEYQQAYGDYIKQVAKSYCLPILNLTEDSGFCPYISTFSDMWTLQPEGYQSHDGVHPNEEYERRFLAPMIKHFLQGLM